MKRQEKKYTWFGNLLFNMKCAKIWDRQLFFYQFLPVIPNVAATFLGVWIPARLVSGLEERQDIGTLLLTVSALAFLVWLMKFMADGMDEYIYRNSVMLNRYYELLCCKKIMRLDYDMLEEPECAKLIGNVWNFLRTEHRCRAILRAVPTALAAILGILWYGTMIAGENGVILILAAGNTAVSFLLLNIARKKHLEYQKEIGAFSKKTAYINRQAMERKAGKDVRLFRMAGWLMKKYDEALTDMDQVYRKIHGWYYRKSLAEAVLNFLMNGFSYLYLLALLAKGAISASEFVLFIGLIGEFSAFLYTLAEQVLAMNPVNIQIGHVREFLDLQEKVGWGESAARPEAGVGNSPAAGVRIEFQSVSYTYPGETEPTLKNISLTIESGEKLALIGLNGAGKTTLVKLLCGFYKPTAGRILVNGLPVSAYDREEYYRMISVLFQDSGVMPFDLDWNLTGKDGEKIDRTQLEKVLALSGFSEKYESLPKKGQTLLVREVHEEAVDFSGGERQKLLFARALYKQAPLLILDEPTAALDPIAENELYLKYREAAGGRTSIFISHRLSSTRFCDRILLMENGVIAETGTHESLMEKGGRYAELFEVQSKYYREKGISYE